MSETVSEESTYIRDSTKDGVRRARKRADGESQGDNDRERTGERQTQAERQRGREAGRDDYGYTVEVGNTTPSCLTRTIGRRFVDCVSGGRHPSTSEHRISTYGDGSDPKKTATGSVLEKFSP